MQPNAHIKQGNRANVRKRSCTKYECINALRTIVSGIIQMFHSKKQSNEIRVIL